MTLVAGRGHDAFPLDTAIIAVEAFRRWFDRRLAPRQDTRRKRLNARGRIAVTVMTVAVIAALVLVSAVNRAFGHDAAAWNQLAAAITSVLAVQFVMLHIAARKGLCARAAWVNWSRPVPSGPASRRR
jgi:sterol desaturase/sphingolipid hydroxylase (fatty acid hydroxylase superfamily)